jgi:hypothetical protein
MVKIRVHELAEELGISSGELLRWLRDAGEFVKSASSTVEGPAARKAREAHAARRPAQTDAALPLDVALLAKELRVRPNEVLKAAEGVGIHLTRVAARVTPSQADEIRGALARKSLQETRAALRPPGAPAARREAPEPSFGPPHACDCCGLRIAAQPGADVARCDICAKHHAVSGEDEARVLARLQDHERRLRRAYAVTWTLEHEAEEKMRGAYRSRDAWRGALVEIMGEHEESPTGCTCGAKVFPCLTWRYLERANRGVLQQVEGFLALKDDERDWALYRRDHWDVG